MASPLILAFGNQARQGKGAAVSHLVRVYGDQLNILRISFADALRREVAEAIAHVQKVSGVSAQESLRFLCGFLELPYEPAAEKCHVYPLGKQRALYQFWGVWRRSECPTYWVDQVAAEIERQRPDVVLIDDLRFENEAHWVKSLGGKTIKVERPGYKGLPKEAAQHQSETALNDYSFDALIRIPDGNLPWLQEEAVEVFRFFAANHTHATYL